ncbi:MAG: hypothetical protein OYM47_01330 [Gemmatimonadota bacterium]|nr:hypothetical protein [Gemmatimonadota bacterium]
MWKSIIILALLAHPTWAGCPAMTEQEVQAYQREFNNGYSKTVLFNCAKRLYHMSDEGVMWSESTKELLLAVINRFLEVDNVLKGGGYILWTDTPPVPADFKEFAAMLLRTVAWQKDVRYAPFISKYLGSGLLAVNSLTMIGEPAFEFALNRLDRKYDGKSSQGGAIKVFKNWFKEQQPFLQGGPKQHLLKQNLLRISKESHDSYKGASIEILQYIKDRDVIDHLTMISQNASFSKVIRTRARDAVEILQGR